MAPYHREVADASPAAFESTSEDRAPVGRSSIPQHRRGQDAGFGRDHEVGRTTAEGQYRRRIGDQMLVIVSVYVIDAPIEPNRRERVRSRHGENGGNVGVGK